MTKNHRLIYSGEGTFDGSYINLQNVVKTYEDTSESFTALKNINLEIQKGEYLSIIGKSGAGKTTLLNTITGVDYLTSGSVHIGGVNIYQLTESQRALWRGRTIGIVLQSFQLIPNLTILDNILLPMEFCDLYTPGKSHQYAQRLLEMVELEAHTDKLPSEISGGQQQRAAIARALANDPPILIADEPTGSLDSATAETVYQVFDRLAGQGKTVIIVSHDSTISERTQRTILISNGEIINEHIARAFPYLSHEQMLEVDRKSERLIYQPGQYILSENETNTRQAFLLIQGLADLTVKEDRMSYASFRLEPGDLFNEAALLEKDFHPICVQSVGKEPVIVLSLDSSLIKPLLVNSDETISMLSQITTQRLTKVM